MEIRQLLAGLAAALALAGPGVGLADAADPPARTASSSLVVDGRDGHAIYGSGQRVRRQVASTTKLMTALLALEELPLDEVLTAPRYTPSSAAESLLNLRTGERMQVADLLRALLLESANDAAVTLADGVSGSQRAFVRKMNHRARQLSLRDTHYANPIGLDDPRNYSSARDLARLARRLMGNEFFAETVKMSRARLLTGAFPRTIENRNDLVGKYPWVNGIKTGHTRRAGYVLVGSGTRNGARVVSVVLGTPSEAARDSDTLELLNYGFSRFKKVEPVRKGATLSEAKVDFYRNEKAKLIGARSVSLSVRRGQRVSTVVRAPDQVKGPLPAGKRVGSVKVLVAGRAVDTVPLVTADEVPGANLLRKVAYYALRWPILLAAALIGAFAYIRRRRRRAAAEAARRRRRRAAGLS